MRILHICPTDRLTSALAPASLQYLGHHIDRRGIDEIPMADRESLSADIVVADACLDLSLAPRIAEVVAARKLGVPVIVVLGEGGLATASAKWNVSDLILTTAGPAEVEARLRVARDRHSDAQRSTTSPTGPALGRGFAGGRGYPDSRGYVGGRGFTGTGAAGGSGLPGHPGSSITNRTGEPLAGEGPFNADGEPMIVVTGTLRIDETAFTADLRGRSLDLTYREFALLKFFALHPERVFTRDEILAAVWGDDYFGGTRTVDVHVRRLRAKLGKDLENAIHTVRNVGYRFSADSVTEAEDVTA